MVVDWEQETGLLMSSGDVRIVRVWDTDREMKVQDIPTGADSCVTSLSCDSHRSLIVAGLGDGSVRVYDRRMALSECRVMTYREHTAWVVKACLQKRPEGHIVSVSVNGDVRFFDPRMPESVNVIQIVKGLTALDIHPQASLIACGSMNQFTAIYSGPATSSTTSSTTTASWASGSAPSAAWPSIHTGLTWPWAATTTTCPCTRWRSASGSGAHPARRPCTEWTCRCRHAGPDLAADARAGPCVVCLSVHLRCHTQEPREGGSGGLVL